MRITDEVMSYDWPPVLDEQGQIDLAETFSDFLDGYDTGDMEYGDFFTVKAWDGPTLLGTALVELTAYPQTHCRIADIQQKL